MCIIFRNCLVVLRTHLYNGKLIFKFITVPGSLKPLYRICSRSIFIIFSFLIFANFTASAAPDGKALFMSKCASCHNPLKESTGPALQNIDKTLPSKEWLYNWVHNSQKLVDAGDAEAVRGRKECVAVMPSFPDLSTDDIDAIITYVNGYKPPV